MTKKDEEKDKDERDRDEDEQDSDEEREDDEDSDEGEDEEESEDSDEEDDDSDEEDSDEEDDDSDEEDDDDSDEEDDDDSDEEESPEDAETVPRKVAASPPADKAKPAEKAKAAAETDEDEDEDDEDEDEDEEESSDEDDEDEEDSEDEDEDEDEDEEDEDEAPAASARPVARTIDQRAERARRRRELGAVGHGDEPADGEDPYWWSPHAVLGALVLFGLLGFFGVFNKALGFLAHKPAGEGDSAAATPEPAKPGTTAPVPRGGGSADAPKEMFGAKHLLVMYKGSRRAPPTIERSKDEAKARATEAMKKAKSGTKFEDLVKEYSDEPGAAQRGGDLGQFPKGSMVPEFQAGLEKIKVGEISDLVETPFGFHVILRTK